MKNILIITSIIILSGCSSLFTQHKEVAVDKLYIQKQCPIFTHTFEINGRKYKTNDTIETVVVLPIDSLTESLAKNTKAREIFNNSIIESNKEVLVPDTSVGSGAERVVKRIYVDRVCPQYHYTPEFNAKKLTHNFIPNENTTYVVIPLDNLITQLEKHKKTKEVFNSTVDELNAKPFPLNILELDR